ncbi:MAG: ABC transporter permease [Clostridia bacterium]|nr:ABC transporter permease [Clostridia bacterium]
MWNSILDVLKLFLSGDQKLYEIIFLSLKVSFSAVLIGVLIGIPIGSFMGMVDFKGHKLMVILIYTLMGMPPVLAGVAIYLLLSANGPLGQWQLLFTPGAMIMAQVVLVTPIIAGLTMVAVRSRVKIFFESAVSLGANKVQIAWLITREAKNGIMAAVVTAFGRAIAEVGAVMLVGGNIENYTRVMTTSIILETRKGNFDLALGLGIVLLVISFLINGFLVAGVLPYLQRGEQV